MGSDEQTAVIIYTDSFRIEGSIALLPNARLTDFIRSSQDFIAVTNATVADKSGKTLFATSFLDVGRKRIELIMPAALVQWAVAVRKLSQKASEELSDARLLLETAAHNVNVVIRQNGPDDALATALELAEQAASALRRIKQALG